MSGGVVEIEDGPDMMDGGRPACVQGPLRAVTHYVGPDGHPWWRLEIDLFGNDHETVKITRRGEHLVKTFRSSS